jgi:hypothetical protein
MEKHLTMVIILRSSLIQWIAGLEPALQASAERFQALVAVAVELRWVENASSGRHMSNTSWNDLIAAILRPAATCD